MKFKVGDKVRYKHRNPSDNVEVGEVGTICGISEVTGNYGVAFETKDVYKHNCAGLCHDNYGWWCEENTLELVVSTLAEIKEKKLTCCINVRSIAEAQFLDDFFECKSYLREYCENAYKERMRLGYYRTLEDGVAFQLTDGVINDNCSANFYRSCGSRYGEVYEFSDLFPVGSTMACGDRIYQRIESGITNYKLVPEYKEGGVVTLKPRDESMSFASAHYLDLSLVLPTNSRELEEKFNEELAKHFNASSNGFRGGKKPEYVLNEKQAKEYADNIMATAESISHITGIPYENSINKLKTCLGAFPNNGISAKNGGKNSMKFTFYVTEGTRVDKSCNGTIPTMTTMVSYTDKYGCIMKGTATCDKTDYDERQGVLEAFANATCGNDFYKVYAEAVKEKKHRDITDRTCTYCGKVFDTIEEKQAHEAWHVERKKARRERYLLRRRAKEIAFEEQAQKMAKEIIAEDNKK